MEIFNFVLIIILFFLVLYILFKKEKKITTKDILLKNYSGFYDGYSQEDKNNDNNVELSNIEDKLSGLEKFLGIQYIYEQTEPVKYIKTKKTKKVKK